MQQQERLALAVRVFRAVARDDRAARDSALSALYAASVEDPAAASLQQALARRADAARVKADPEQLAVLNEWVTVAMAAWIGCDLETFERTVMEAIAAERSAV